MFNVVKNAPKLKGGLFLCILRFQKPCLSVVNPLTPVPPVTARDEAWPFFLFWRHRFWPKLASSILNFCRRRRSFQWCPDQSDRPNGALDMHENAQKVGAKISCHYTGMLHAKNYPSWWRFLRSFLTTSKPSRRSIPAAKTREKEKKEGRKKKFLISKFWFLCMPESQCTKTRCWWQERPAVVLQTHFPSDQS